MPPETPATKALIYCRVSSVKQATEGHGLDSQETRCRQYARDKGYEVEAVFPDDVSGGGDFMKRPGMVALLSYLDAQRDRKNYVVVFDDLKRFARDTEFHIKLRRAFRMRGARVECLNFRFEDTPEGKFVETILAAQGELEREQNSRQVVQKMKARAMNGYWPFHAPVGYRHDKVPGHGKLLVRDEPLASIAAEALNGYASSRFETAVEVKRFLESQPAWPKDRKGEVHPERVTELLTRPIYAGYVHHERWNLNFVPGQHKGLITLETWQVIQDRRNGKSKAPTRKDLHEDFPLRGFVACACCGEPMTACWSKGRNRLYPYYLCDTRGCPEYRKSFRKEKLEDEFAALLLDLKPSPALFSVAFEMFRDQWNAKLEGLGAQSTTLRNDIRLIESKMDGLLDRIVDAESPTVVTAYEKRIRDLEAQRAIMAEKIAACGRPLAPFDQTYRTAFAFLANPCYLWESPRIEDRRAVLRLVFADRLAYARNEGYRTAEITLPFKLLGEMKMEKTEMVPLAGIEPALLAERDFESRASTNSATGAHPTPASRRPAADYTASAPVVNCRVRSTTRLPLHPPGLPA